MAHMRASVLIRITSLARRSRVPLVFAGVDSLQVSKKKKKVKHGAKFETVKPNPARGIKVKSPRLLLTRELLIFH